MTVKYSKSNNEQFISDTFFHGSKIMEEFARFALVSTVEISVECALDTIEYERIPVDEVSLKYLKTHINNDMIKQMAVGFVTDHLNDMKEILIEKINKAEVIANITNISYKENANNANNITDVGIDLGISFPTE